MSLPKINMSFNDMIWDKGRPEDLHPLVRAAGQRLETGAPLVVRGKSLPASAACAAVSSALWADSYQGSPVVPFLGVCFKGKIKSITHE